MDSLVQDWAQLAGYPSRMVGAEGHDAAADYIRAQFRAMGLEIVGEAASTVLVPHVELARLELEGQEHAMRVYPLWPNLVRLPATGPRGLHGRVLYAGTSRPEEYDGLDVAGNFVLLEWECADRWRLAAQWGAAAVFFIEPTTATRAHGGAKIARAPHAIPRYWMPRAEGEYLRARCRREAVEARLTVRTEWREQAATTIVARLPGTDPLLADEAVFVEAHYDAMSVVPELAPGAEQAAGMVAMLALARRLRAVPPARSVVFLAASAHHFAMQGIVEFLARGQYQRGLPASLRWPDLGLAYKRWVMLSLELSSGSDRVGLQSANREVFFDSMPLTARANSLAAAGREIDRFLAARFAGSSVDWETRFFNGISMPRGRRIGERLPGGFPFGAEAAELRGEVGFGLVTLDDERPHIDTPHDTLARCSPGALARQLDLCEAVLRYLTESRRLPPNLDPWPRDQMAMVEGRVLAQERGAFVADVPVPGALVLALRQPHHSVGAVRSDRMTRADASGRYRIHGLEIRQWGVPRAVYRFDAFVCDPRDGAILYATDMGGKAHGTLPITLEPKGVVNRRELIVFPCAPVELFDIHCFKDLAPLAMRPPTVLDAQSDTEPYSHGYFWQGANFPRVQEQGNVLVESSGVVFVPLDLSIKLVSYNQLGHPQVLLPGPLGGETAAEQEQLRLGRGLNPRRDAVIGDVPLRSAAAMLGLARWRMETFERHGIRNDHLAEILDRGQALLIEAEAARASLRHAAAWKAAHEAWAMLAKSYPEVKRTADDMVLAVMFYLALLTPFVFFAERLLCGYTDIRKRLAALALLFLAAFFVLRYVHPAFEIAITPALLLLSFLVFVLSAGVTVIVLRKFKAQSRRLREELGEVHVADIGRLGAGAAAFSLGVSNLRNRPARTALTCATIVILMFCVLSFVSLRTVLGFRKFERPGSAPYHGMLLVEWAGDPLPAQRLDLLRARYAGRKDAAVAPRVWHWAKGMYWEPVESYFDVRGGAAGASPYSVAALLELSPEERRITGLDRSLTQGRWFQEHDVDAVIVPSALAAQLALADPAVELVTVEIRAKPYRVIGVFDEARYREILDLDGLPVAPLDRIGSAARLEIVRGAARLGDRAIDLSGLVRLQPDRFVLVCHRRTGWPELPLARAEWRPDSLLASIAVAFDDPETAEREARQLAIGAAYPIYCGFHGKCYQYSAQGAAALHGVGGLWAPIGVTILIVFNTMLGSVYERRKEIGVFSALGLAPSHIGFLFLAEACVYANLAVVLGYLLGQGAGKIMAALGVFPGVAFNYSASAAVGVSLAIALVTLGSSVYPAWLGARMSAPSIERSWRLPAPVENRFEIALPFTVGRAEAAGLFGYLYEFVTAHADFVLGSFYAEQVRLALEEAPELSCKMWLAPYDLGVSQTMRLTAAPSMVGGFYEFVLVLERLEGDVASWTRANRMFLGALRKQMLIWRALTPAQRRRYIAGEGSHV